MQKTCEERIDAQLKHAMTRLCEALRDDETYALECEECGHKWQSEEELDDCPECDSVDVIAEEEERETHDSYMESVLEIAPLHIVYRVGLSYGGPADGFYLYVDPEDKTIDKIEYYFQDWFDGATRTLHGDKFDAVCNMFGPYIEL